MNLNYEPRIDEHQRTRTGNYRSRSWRWNDLLWELRAWRACGFDCWNPAAFKAYARRCEMKRQRRICRQKRGWGF